MAKIIPPPLHFTGYHEPRPYSPENQNPPWPPLDRVDLTPYFRSFLGLFSFYSGNNGTTLVGI